MKSPERDVTWNTQRGADALDQIGSYPSKLQNESIFPYISFYSLIFTQHLFSWTHIHARMAHVLLRNSWKMHPGAELNHQPAGRPAQLESYKKKKKDNFYIYL